MSVQIPPNIDANDIGMRSFDGLALVSFATPIRIGIKIATTGVLLMNAEKNPTKTVNKTKPSQ